MRYKGAISDTDILINLAKANSLDILELLFKEIVVPQYIYEHEIRLKAGRFYSIIVSEINKEGSIFKILDRKKDRYLNFLSKDIIEEKKNIIGPGESECAGYATALKIPIIISDNHSEFKYLTEYITLTHRNLLSLCVYFKDLTMEEATEIFHSINNQLSRPTDNDFTYFYNSSMQIFRENGWDRYLFKVGIK